MQRVKQLFLLPAVSFLLFLIVAFFMTGVWFGEGEVIIGHDAGFALDAKQDFLKRFYTWWDGVNFGFDGSAYVGSWFIHLIDLLSAELTQSKGGGNQYVVLFWFSAMFLSALSFSWYIGKKLYQPLLILFAPFFYVFNFFVFQSVFMFERTKYELMIALPLFLMVCFLVREKKLSILRGSIAASIVFFIFNGGGWGGAPLYGSIIVAAVVLALYTFLESVQSKQFFQVKRLTALYVVTLIFTLFLDAYSLLPVIQTKIVNYQAILSASGGASGQLSWVETVSSNASFLNMLRFQGSPDWFTDTHVVNNDHPYASLYTSSPVLLFFSFFIPLFFVLALFFAREKYQKRSIMFFLFLSLVGMFFAAGSHPPLGFLYTFFYTYVPGFAIFRSPFFKFSPVYILGISMVMAFGIGAVIQTIQKKISRKIQVTVGLLLSICIIVAWMYYHFVFFGKNIFHWQKDFSTLVNVPSYVWEFEQWVDNLPSASSRILLLPTNNIGWKADAYTWGYWSLTPLPHLLTNKSILVNDNLLNSDEENLVLTLYEAIKKNNDEKIRAIVKSLGVEYLVLRKDVAYQSKSSPLDDPFLYEEQLERIPFIKKARSFGKWSVYKINQSSQTKVYAVDGVVAVDAIDNYFDTGEITSVFFLAEDPLRIDSLPAEFITQTVKSIPCSSCGGEEVFSIASPSVIILPGSPLYIVKQQQEKRLTATFNTKVESIHGLLGFSLKRDAEIKALIALKRSQKDLLIAVEELQRIYDELLRILNSEDLLRNDVVLAKRISSYISYVSRDLKSILANEQLEMKYPVASNIFVDIVWEQQKILKLLSEEFDQSELSGVKKLRFLVAQPGQYTLFLDTGTFPKTVQGKAITPELMTITNERGVAFQPVPIRQDRYGGDGIISLPLLFKESGSYTMELFFPSLPNLIESTSSHIVRFLFPTGERNCAGGVLPLSPGKNMYKVNLVRSGDNKKISFVIDEERTKNIERSHGFFRPEIEIRLSDRITVDEEKKFEYLYNPDDSVTSARVYVCSYLEVPAITDFSVREVFVPRVILRSEAVRKNSDSLPNITYSKVNPTQYSITIGKVGRPFILVFNEQFNPLWKLYERSNTQQALKKKQVKINGFANGWIFEKSEGMSLLLEYEPQKQFFRGMVITSITLLVFSSYFFYSFIRRIRSKKHE